jgi:hypothetical protein
MFMLNCPAAVITKDPGKSMQSIATGIHKHDKPALNAGGFD